MIVLPLIFNGVFALSSTCIEGAQYLAR
jgi:hypothetical protein